jgi:ribosomal-protein-alanine N-acetyltransferase
MAIVNETDQYYVEPMQVEDVPEVSRVERECFSNPWPQSAYRRELRNPANNYYIVLRHRAPRRDERPARHERGPFSLLPLLRRAEPPATEGDPIVGFAGMWVLFDEAHVTTIGVSPQLRGKGLGELLLLDLVDEALRRNAEWLTLEVRVSNTPAQALYEKLGFTRQGVRRRYYSDNGEDAYIMWSPSIRTQEFRERVARLRLALRQRLGDALLERPGERETGLP